MNFLKNNFLSLFAAAGILFGIYMSKGGVAIALVPLVRVILPVLAVLMVLKLIKNKIGSAVGGGFKAKMKEAMEEMQRRQEAAGGGAANGQTLDLCSDCGVYKQPGHVCK
jgi:hypothetical protein